MPTDRQATILCTTVREYIRTGIPVGSETLLVRARLPWSPATVRAEFSELEEEGFLQHPHQSAGRVPTRRGYRYYVDHTTAHAPSHAAVAVLRRFGPAMEENREAAFTRELAYLLARLSGMLAVVALSEHAVHEAGLPNLFRMREIADHEMASDIERVLHAMEDDIAVLLNHMAEGQPTVFINGENPLARVERVSIVATAPTLPTGSLLFVALIGPLRMSYPRHLQLLRAVHSLQSP
ncbi:MAG: hypothetical protein Q8R32_00970 [bacterium]|nr:hypothetical protein [bacterium]